MIETDTERSNFIRVLTIETGIERGISFTSQIKLEVGTDGSV